MVPEEMQKGVCLIGKRMKDITVVISTHAGEQEIKHFLDRSNFPADRIFMMSPYIFCVDPDQYFSPDFMSFEEEVFVDAGCKDLEASFCLYGIIPTLPVKLFCMLSCHNHIC